MYLYLDSTSQVICGLISKEGWVDYEQLQSKKGSTLMHGAAYEILKKQNLKLKDIEGVILASGPGSYTGMRLAEGFAQILEWRDIPIYSFYHFEVPEFLGFEKGVWVSSAFKGEFFFYEWPKSQKEDLLKNLLTAEAFWPWFEKRVEELKEENIFCHLTSLFEGKEFVPQSTFDLIRDNPVSLFDHVLQRGKRLQPFYYRPLEREFKVPN